MKKKAQKKIKEYFKIERLKEISAETLFVVSLALVFFLILVVSVVRSQQLLNLAEMLPVDGVTAFWVYDMDDYLASGMTAPEIFGSQITSFDWFDGEFGTAILDEEAVYFLDVAKRSEARDSLEGMLIENEKFTENESKESGQFEKIYCFEYSHPDCFVFLGDVLVTSTSVSALEEIRSAVDDGQTLETTNEYQNSKGRLPLTSDAFAFVNLKEARKNLFQALGNIGIFEPGYFESVLRIFPSLAFTADMNSGNPGYWDAEMFVAVDKNVINNEAFYRSGGKYNGDLLELSSEGYAFEWGGADLAAQLQRISAILHQLNESAALVFDSGLKTYLKKYFGESFNETDVYQLLQNEYYFGWTPDEKMLLILGLDEGEFDTAEQLKDAFASNFRSANEYQENGETKASIEKLEGFSSNYNGQRYYHFNAGGQEYIFISIMDNLAVVSTSREDFFATLDKIKTRQNLRRLDDTGLSLWGVDEIFSIDMEFFPEGHILKTALKNFGKITQTRKLFDDGIYSKFNLQLNPQLSEQSNDDQSEYRAGTQE